MMMFWTTIAISFIAWVTMADANGKLEDYLKQLEDIKKEYHAKPHSSYRNSGFRLMEATAEWNYSKGGGDWEGTCASGSRQSPINIESIRGTCDNSMTFELALNDTTQALTVTNTGTTLRIDGYIGTLYATDVDGILYGYSCKYMQFHAPSEHKIEGDSFDAETQIVCPIMGSFKASKRSIAIVSILWNHDDTVGDNAFIGALPISTTATTAASVSLNLNTSLQMQLATPIVYYSYPGSITIPPCTEAVNWYVIESPLTLSTAQKTKFYNLWSENPHFADGYGNNRITKSVNERTIKKGGDACEEQFVYFFSFFILYVFINYFIFKLL